MLTLSFNLLVYVLGGNLDSIFNDVGMLLVSGIFRNGCCHSLIAVESMNRDPLSKVTTTSTSVLRASLLPAQVEVQIDDEDLSTSTATNEERTTI